MSEQEKAKQVTTSGSAEKQPTDREAAPLSKDKDTTDKPTTEQKKDPKEIFVHH